MKLAKVAPQYVAKARAIVKEYHDQFTPELEVPEVRIVNSVRSGWLGRCLWKATAPTNTVIEIQESIIADETTLRKVAAHEICHHSDFILNYARMLPWQRKGWDGHGTTWKAMAEKVNAVLGAGFVTKTSDQSYVLADTGKKYYLAVIMWHNGTLRYAVTLNPSQKQVDFMQQKMNGSRDIVKLFQTTDPEFVHGCNLGTGWVKPTTPEGEAKLKQFWDSGEEVALTPPKKTPLNPKAVGAKIFNEAKSSGYGSTMVKKFLCDPDQLSRYASRSMPTHLRLLRQKLSREQWKEIADVIQHILDLTLPPEYKGADTAKLLEGSRAGKFAQQGDRNSYVPRIHVDPVGLHREPMFGEEPGQEEDNPPVFKMIAKTKLSFINNDLLWLKHYLTMSGRDKGEEVARAFEYKFKEYLQDNDSELFDQLYPDGGEDEYLDDYSSVPDDVLTSFYEDVSDYIMQNDPADAPSFMHMSFEKIVKNQWLIHKTDDANGICRSGFTIGMDDLSRLGLTTYFKNSAKSGGYNFAFDAADARIAEDRYGNDAVIFRASGIEVYHYGDEEDQVIFKGSDARDIIPVYRDRGGYDWVLSNDDHGKPVFGANTLAEIVQWVEANYSQYRKVIVKRASFNNASPSLTPDEISSFSQGKCHVFALALNQALGFDIQVVMGSDVIDGTWYLVHAFAARPDGTLVDVTGTISEEDATYDHGDCYDPELLEIDPQEVRKFCTSKKWGVCSQRDINKAVAWINANLDIYRDGLRNLNQEID